MENTKNLKTIKFCIIFHRIDSIDLSELDGWTKPTNVTPTLVAKGCPVYTSKFHSLPKPGCIPTGPVLRAV